MAELIGKLSAGSGLSGDLSALPAPDPADLSGSLSPPGSMHGAITIPPVAPIPPYEGSYTVTPSAQTQVLETNGLRMTGDVTVEPIPNNYGLITWDGTVLTVS